MSRPRTGNLYWVKSGWRARLWVQVEGEWLRKSFDLGTTNKAVARIRMKRLQSENLPLETLKAEAARSETFKEAAERIVAEQKANGLTTHKERLARLTNYAFESLGPMLPADIKQSHVNDVLKFALKQGKSEQTIRHLRNDLAGVFKQLWRDDVVSENPVLKSEMPQAATSDDRERVILTDDEFGRFMACPDVKPELHVMALTSRTLGGMRTSDLHAWDWSHVDTAHWIDAHVPRPKTKRHQKRGGRERIGLPDQLVPVLQSWWDAAGRPTRGPVFPIRKGPKAGQRKHNSSYAKRLRSALWSAGVHRPLPGFDGALADLRALPADASDRVRLRAERDAKALCLIQSGSDDFLPLDFHSFRRQFSTALGAAGVSVQQAMALAGHRSASTHMRYVLLAQGRTLQTPEAAMPRLGVLASSVPKLPEQNSQSSCFDAWADTDLNRGPLACKGASAGETADVTADSEPPSLAEHPPSPPHARIPLPELDAVESALSAALQAATAAGQWALVAQLAGELAARRRDAANVVSLADARARKGGA